jgi:hypothetical protein
MEKKKRTFLVLDIRPELKTKIKVIAARKNVTMAMWAEQAMLVKLEEDTKYDKK